MPEALRTGTVIGGVTIRQQLGRGGFGITYLAEETGQRRLYALKEYFPSDFAYRTAGNSVEARPDWRHEFETGRRAFYEEANILKVLPRQRGLVKVRGAFEKHGTVYCLMEFIEGEPLDRIVARYAREGRSVPEPLVADFVRCIAAALGVVHEAGLIHRDIKPANVMIRRSDGQPVLIDFGASRQVDRAPDPTSILTREYAPLEQFPLDWSRLGMRLREGPWSDLFSLSVLLYRALSHRLPLDARARLLALRSGDGGGYLPLARAIEAGPVTERYSRRLTELVDYGAQLFPADRPADAMAFAGLLDASAPTDRTRLQTHIRFGAADCVADLGALQQAFDAAPRAARPGTAAAAPSGPARPVSRPAVPRRSGQRRLIWAVLILLAALAAVVLAVAEAPMLGGAT